MRKKLQDIYDKSEGIINTGHSYLFFSNAEKMKYNEVYLPADDLDEKEFGMVMLESEWREVVDSFEKDGMPFYIGDIVEKSIEIFHGDSREFLYEVAEYRKKKEAEKNVSLEKSIPAWELLNENQKKIINDLAAEFVKLNQKK